MKRAILVVVAMSFAWCAAARQSERLSEAQIRELVRESADRDLENTRRQRDYTYIQRTEQRRLDGSGNTRSSEVKTYEIMILSGEPTGKLVAKNDVPLSEKEARKEEERIRKLIEKYQKEDEGARRRRLLKSEKEAEEDRQFVREIADAYRFRFVGSEPVDGRAAWVIDADPIPGYKARHKDAKNLSKFRFRAWVDVEDRQWVRLDIEAIDTVSWGLFLARIGKGAQLHLEQTRVNDEVWLPRQINIRADAKLGLLKTFRMGLEIAYGNYRKFQTESNIVDIEEAAPVQ